MMLGKELHLYLDQRFFCRSAAFAGGGKVGRGKFFDGFRHRPWHF